MAGLLSEIFSAGNVAKRKLTDLLGNPLESAQQILGNMNDRARVLNQMTAAAAREGVAYGPASQQLGGLLSEAYNPVGLTVFHGSPYPFKKFDPTKIGSGEGAQAYGYGHYVAQNPAVASEYQNTLREIGYSYNGEKIDKLKQPVRETAAKLLYESKGDMSLAIKAADRYAYDDLLKKELATMDPSKVSIGNLYKIDLPDEQIAKMLDWDNPIKDQKEVLTAIRNQINDNDIVKSFDANVKSGISGANAMQNYVWGKTPAEKSEALRQAGVPGIRYLDQGSRGVGEGTSNFVVFPGNEDLLKILERNNQPLGLLE